MRHLVPHLTFMMLALLPTGEAMAFEAAGVPGLQLGPIGEGVAFEDLGPATGEGLVRLVSISGDERRGDETQRISGQATEVAVASGFGVNPNLDFVIRMHHLRSAIKGEGDDVLGDAKSTWDMTELIAGPTLWFGDLMLGAHASVLSYGQEVLESGDAKAKVGAVSMPRLRLYTAARSGAMTVMARAILYNDARTSLTGVTADGDDLDTDIKRRSAGETSLDARLNVAKDMALAASFTYVGAERATDGTDSDYFVYGAGGLYTAAPWLALAGGIHYTESHFATDRNASVMKDNLGGLRLDVGSHYTLQDLTANFDMGYVIPELAVYTDTETDTKVQLERAVWDLALGLTLNF